VTRALKSKRSVPVAGRTSRKVGSQLFHSDLVAVVPDREAVAVPVLGVDGLGVGVLGVAVLGGGVGVAWSTASALVPGCSPHATSATIRAPAPTIVRTDLT
jgi:hypothetical protein